MMQGTTKPTIYDYEEEPQPVEVVSDGLLALCMGAFCGAFSVALLWAICAWAF